MHDSKLLLDFRYLNYFFNYILKLTQPTFLFIFSINPLFFYSYIMYINSITLALCIMSLVYSVESRPSICVQGINLNNADDSWNPPRVTYTDCNESNLCESRCGDCERDENKGTMTCYCSKDNPYPGILSYRVEPWYLGDEGDTCPIRPCHKALEYVSEFFGTGAYEQYGSGYTRCCEYFKTYECAT